MKILGKRIKKKRILKKLLIFLIIVASFSLLITSLLPLLNLL